MIRSFLLKIVAANETQLYQYKGGSGEMVRNSNAAATIHSGRADEVQNCT